LPPLPEFGYGGTLTLVMESPQTFYFSAEIEQALVAACFQHPERISRVKRDLDVEAAITNRAYRYVLLATEFAYRELGSTDFADLIQILREQGQLADCGGLEGVNNILEQYRFGFSSPQAAEEIIAHYIEMLKNYAVARQTRVPFKFFVGGRGSLAQNKLKAHPSQPDFTGSAQITGKTYDVKGWLSADGQSLNLKFDEL
jgi:hypothetical protein